jgi:hypothetical protein
VGVVVDGVASGCVLAAIGLLVAGIGLLRRRAWTATAIVLWAVVKIGLEVGVAIAAAAMQREMVQAMAAGSRPGVPVSFEQWMLIVPFVVSIVLYCAFPVFLLVWFLREKVRKRMGERA